MVTRPLRRSVVGNCMIFAVHNQLGRLRLIGGRIESDGGMAHARLRLDESLAYIRMVFDEYKREAGVEHFAGRAAEIGPGDNCGVALLLLADGCDSVDLVDRFYSKRSESQHAEIYRALIAGDARLRNRFGSAQREEDFPGIARHYGEHASAERFFRESGPYDLIVSRAVMEHLHDPMAALRDMVMALRVGGTMLHVVDLRDHGMFSEVGFPETKFLEMPDTLHRIMTDSVGRPNRVSLGAYTRALDRLPVSYTIKVTHLVGGQPLEMPTPYAGIPQEMRHRAEKAIETARGRLARSLRDERTEDLAVSGFFMVARRVPDSAKGDSR